MNNATTDKEYHENSQFWGESQYVTLGNIIDNILVGADDDSYFKNIRRFRAVIFGKLAIKKLNVDVKSESKAMSFVLAPSQVFAYPRYMTNWFKVSVLNKCGKLETLRINNSAQIDEYAQDDDLSLFFDCDGSVFTGDNFNAEKGDCCYERQCATTPECGCEEEDFSESWVKPIKAGGYFQFSPDLVGRDLVIEFQSSGLDGIDDCDIKVHNDLELTVMNFIQYNLLRGKRNTPKGEWKDYYATYKIEKRRSKELLSDKITLEEIQKYVSLRYN